MFQLFKQQQQQQQQQQQPRLKSPVTVCLSEEEEEEEEEEEVEVEEEEEDTGLSGNTINNRTLRSSRYERLTAGATNRKQLQDGGECLFCSPVDLPV
ncbi:hypothetical protein EYF80_049749 [Liparis tanakae]|uniref:Uncharacterized protein n=1 Tax=Liparis tanakae TaxID=230148 RepID=A0A4Z2FFT3_9TELE|nr:hypothetical protein EYF80_049749 [Liparis tanakae]